MSSERRAGAVEGHPLAGLPQGQLAEGAPGHRHSYAVISSSWRKWWNGEPGW
jgi:hypothetical protein